MKKNRHLIGEELESRLIANNTCYHSPQKLLSYSLLSKTVKIKICETAIFPVVLYRCETYSLTLREESKLKGFENRVLGRIVAPKRCGIIGGWRKLHNEELCNLYSSPNSRIFRMTESMRMRWTGHVARM
jgi:hypothetical protein